MIWTETNIIYAVVGMVGLFSTALIFQRANRNAAVYYKQDPRRVVRKESSEEETYS
jgi:uncharacterized membrane protein YuzA (DUF378 family)